MHVLHVIFLLSVNCYVPRSHAGVQLEMIAKDSLDSVFSAKVFITGEAEPSYELGEKFGWSC